MQLSFAKGISKSNEIYPAVCQASADKTQKKSVFENPSLGVERNGEKYPLDLVLRWRAN
jgi:hypothetical protein